MRVVFMGTPTFALPSLNALASNHELVAVYSRPDAKSGRGNKLRPSPVKARAEELGIPVFTPRNFNDENDVAELAALAPDIIVVAAYGVLLPKPVLDIPQHGCINVHASLLPRWRGAAPVQRAILAGDPMLGVSIMRMEEGLDTGDYCCQATLTSGKGTADEVTELLGRLGATALLTALEDIEAGIDEWTVQDPELVTYAHKIEKPEVLLAPDLPYQEAWRRVRASGKTAPARCVVCDKPVTVTAAHIVNPDAPKPRGPRADLEAKTPEQVAVLGPGEVSLDGKKLQLGCADGTLVVDRIKPDGKGEMEASAWIVGLRDAALSWSAQQ